MRKVSSHPDTDGASLNFRTDKRGGCKQTQNTDADEKVAQSISLKSDKGSCSYREDLMGGRGNCGRDARTGSFLETPRKQVRCKNDCGMQIAHRRGAKTGFSLVEGGGKIA